MPPSTATRTPRTTPATPRARTPGRTRAAAPRARAGPRRDTRRAANLLKLIADPTRLEVVLMLAGGEMNVSAMCRALGAMSQPAVSHHLSLCRHSGLIEPRRAGKFNFYRLSPLGRMLAKLAAPLCEG